MCLRIYVALQCWFRFFVSLNGGIFQSTACKINFVNMRKTYVKVLLIYVNLYIVIILFYLMYHSMILSETEINMEHNYVATVMTT